MQIPYGATHIKIEPDGVRKTGELSTPDTGLHESEIKQGMAFKATRCCKGSQGWDVNRKLRLKLHRLNVGT